MGPDRRPLLRDGGAEVPPRALPRAVRAIGDGKGSSVRFSSGGRIYQTKGSSTAYAIRDEVVRPLVATGSVKGKLGYPTAGRVTVGNGWVQHFQKGAISQRGAAKAVHVSGAFASAWRAVGAEQGILGQPIRVASVTARGGYQRFAGGQLWRLGSGAPRRVTGPVLDACMAERGHVGRYGYPTSNTTQLADGRWQCTFEGGTLTA